MSSLFDSVVEGAYTNDYSGEGISSDVDAELESYITDDPYTVASYTSQCFEGMMAAQAAYYALEGQCSVKYLTATDESAKQEAVSTMEASLRGAWETIKDWASRAWEAVKKFIKKIWGKLKGYASLVKTFFKKYHTLLASGKGDNAPVMWGVCHPEQALNYADKWIGIADSEIDNTASRVDAQRGSQTWQNYRDKLYNAVWGADDYSPKKVTFSSVKKDAIKVADMGHDKYLQGFMKLGETKQKEFYAKYKKLINSTNDAIDKAEDEDNKSRKDVLELCKKQFNAAIKIIQECVATYNKAANKMYSQSVKACRVALRYSSGDHTATGESYTDFNSMMSEIL